MPKVDERVDAADGDSLSSTEPVSTESAALESASTDSASTESAALESASTESAVSESAALESAALESAASTESASTESAALQSRPLESARSAAALSEPALSEPALSEPALPEPAPLEVVLAEQVMTAVATSGKVAAVGAMEMPVVDEGRAAGACGGPETLDGVGASIAGVGADAGNEDDARSGAERATAGDFTAGGQPRRGIWMRWASRAKLHAQKNWTDVSSQMTLGIRLRAGIWGARRHIRRAAFGAVGTIIECAGAMICSRKDRDELAPWTSTMRSSPGGVSPRKGSPRSCSGSRDTGGCRIPAPARPRPRPYGSWSAVTRRASRTGCGPRWR
jgi:hypothetical protein